MTKKLVALFISLCLLLGVASAMGEKLTVTAWDANFNGNALQAECRFLRRLQPAERYRALPGPLHQELR